MCLNLPFFKLGCEREPCDAWGTSWELMYHSYAVLSPSRARSRHGVHAALPFETLLSDPRQRLGPSCSAARS